MDACSSKCTCLVVRPSQTLGVVLNQRGEKNPNSELEFYKENVCTGSRSSFRLWKEFTIKKITQYCGKKQGWSHRQNFLSSPAAVFLIIWFVFRRTWAPLKSELICGSSLSLSLYLLIYLCQLQIVFSCSQVVKGKAEMTYEDRSSVAAAVTNGIAKYFHRFLLAIVNVPLISF